MIQLAEDLGYLDSRKILLDPRYRRVFIEIASNLKIDVSVVDASKMSAFDKSDNGDDVDGIDWFDNTRACEFEFEFPSESNQKYYLLLWNSNEDDDAMIAYKVTPLGESFNEATRKARTFAR